MDARLAKEFDYYVRNQKELAHKHMGKFLVIRGEQVVDVYETELDAYRDGAKKFELGTFLIQQALPGDANITQTFHSRVTV